MISLQELKFRLSLFKQCPSDLEVIQEKITLIISHYKNYFVMRLIIQMKGIHSKRYFSLIGKVEQ